MSATIPLEISWQAFIIFREYKNVYTGSLNWTFLSWSTHPQIDISFSLLSSLPVLFYNFPKSLTDSLILPSCNHYTNKLKAPTLPHNLKPPHLQIDLCHQSHLSFTRLKHPDIVSCQSLAFCILIKHPSSPGRTYLWSTMTLDREFCFAFWLKCKGSI